MEFVLLSFPWLEKNPVLEKKVHALTQAIK